MEPAAERPEAGADQTADRGQVLTFFVFGALIVTTCCSPSSS
jgi:hypothetical protein